MDIQQNRLSLSGKKVPMTFGPRNDIAGEVDFTVGQVHDDILSTGKLIRMGFSFHLSMDEGMYMQKGDQSTMVEELPAIHLIGRAISKSMIALARVMAMNSS